MSYVSNDLYDILIIFEMTGAFSAYKNEAIQGQPLQRYFYSMNHVLSPFKANMYLAEDRILCLELIAKQGCNYVLKYVKDAYAHTDVPPSLAGLIRQRRRWLNGTFFTQIYAILHFKRIWTDSHHSMIRKLLLSLEFFYFSVNAAFSWFACANFFICFKLIGKVITPCFQLQQNFDIINPTASSGKGNVKCGSSQNSLSDTIEFLWVFLLVIQMIAGLRNKPEHVAVIHKLSCFFFGCLGYMLIFMVTWILMTSDAYPLYIKLGTLAVFFSPIITCIFHLDFSVALTFFQHRFMLPTFVNVISIYSICNTHDV